MQGLQSDGNAAGPWGADTGPAGCVPNAMACFPIPPPAFPGRLAREAGLKARRRPQGPPERATACSCGEKAGTARARILATDPHRTRTRPRPPNRGLTRSSDAWSPLVEDAGGHEVADCWQGPAALGGTCVRASGRPLILEMPGVILPQTPSAVWEALVPDALLRRSSSPVRPVSPQSGGVPRGPRRPCRCPESSRNKKTPPAATFVANEGVIGARAPRRGHSWAPPEASTGESCRHKARKAFGQPARPVPADGSA